MRVRKFDGCMWGKRKIRKGGIVHFNHSKWKINDTPREYPRAINMPYDDRLDGKWCVVALHDQRFFSHLPLELHSCPPDAWPGDNCVNGVFVWTSFNKMEK